MTHPQNAKIIAFVGLTGSGKSTAVEYFTRKSYPKVYFGGIIYAAMAEAGIAKGEKNEKTFRVDIRKKEGDDFAVKRIISQIHDLIASGQRRIIADGLYTWDEYKSLKHEFAGEITVVAIITPRHTRYQRLLTREDRPQTETESISRDWSEIETIQKGGPIAMADYFVMNDDDNLEMFYNQLDTIAKDTEFYE
jgi:dephospho-CoA kinase